MSPTYNDCDWILFRRLKSVKARSLVRLVGKVVVAERESYPGIHFIKRVISVSESGLWLEGDNKDASTDSRSWGALTPDEIVGVVFFRYRRG